MTRWHPGFALLLAVVMVGCGATRQDPTAEKTKGGGADDTSAAGAVAAKRATANVPERNVPPPKIYTLQEMPRVNTHVHVGKVEQMARLIETMDQAHVTISINVSGDREMVQQAKDIQEKWKGRILIAPGSYKTKDKLWWSMEDLDSFAKAGCAGLKIHCHYERGINSEENMAKIRRQGALGLPVLGFHIADPPEGRYLKPDRQACIDDAMTVIEACPKTTFIMAHGFWLMNNDQDLDTLAGYFDRNPNLYVELSAVDQWWDRPNPTPEKLRAFVLRYQDRLMYGTDGSPSYSTKQHFENSYRVLETADELKEGFFPGEKDRQTIKGLGLPLETLNRIYWWNAARTIPRVREVLRDLGYAV